MLFPTTTEIPCMHKLYCRTVSSTESTDCVTRQNLASPTRRDRDVQVMPLHWFWIDVVERLEVDDRVRQHHATGVGHLHTRHEPPVTTTVQQWARSDQHPRAHDEHVLLQVTCTLVLHLCGM